MKIVEGDTFYSYYILYQYFENSPKIQKRSDRQKKHKSGSQPCG